MSDQIQELDCWEPRIQCEQAGSVWLQSEEIERHDDEIAAQVAVEASRDQVRVSVSEGEPDTDTIAGATVYLAPDGARDLAERLQDDEAVRFTKSDCCWWLRMGWLAHDGPSRSDESTVGELEWACGSLSAVVSQTREDVSGTLLVAAELTDTERTWMVEQLVDAADTAVDYESISFESGTTADETSRAARIKKRTQIVVSGGISLGIVGVVSMASFSAYNAVIAGEVTINESPLPELSLLPAGLSFVLFITLIWMIGYGVAGGLPRPGGAR